MDSGKSKTELQQVYPLGMNVSNALEAIEGMVDPKHEVRNWETTLHYNRFQGKDATDIVAEFINSGANESHLSSLVSGIRNLYPETEKRPVYVDEVLKSIESKLNPQD